ncbi:hypothetical protein HK096_008330, partial [Nowakowskiella sp. JEL0078]
MFSSRSISDGMKVQTSILQLRNADEEILNDWIRIYFIENCRLSTLSRKKFKIPKPPNFMFYQSSRKIPFLSETDCIGVAQKRLKSI